MVKGWAMDGCDNRVRHFQNANYFGPNIEATPALVSVLRFTYGDVRVEGVDGNYPFSITTASG